MSTEGESRLCLTVNGRSVQFAVDRRFSIIRGLYGDVFSRARADAQRSGLLRLLDLSLQATAGLEWPPLEALLEPLWFFLSSGSASWNEVPSRVSPPEAGEGIDSIPADTLNRLANRVRVFMQDQGSPWVLRDDGPTIGPAPGDPAPTAPGGVATPGSATPAGTGPTIGAAPPPVVVPQDFVVPGTGWENAVTVPTGQKLTKRKATTDPFPKIRIKSYSVLSAWTQTGKASKGTTPALASREYTRQVRITFQQVRYSKLEWSYWCPGGFLSTPSETDKVEVYGEILKEWTETVTETRWKNGMHTTYAGGTLDPTLFPPPAQSPPDIGGVKPAPTPPP